MPKDEIKAYIEASDNASDYADHIAETLEQDIQQIAGCRGAFAVAAVPDDVRGDAVLLAVTLKISELTPILTAAAEVVLKRYGINQAGIVRLLSVSELPVTDTGKIQRKHLRDVYMAQERPPTDGATQAQEMVGDDPPYGWCNASTRDGW